MEQSTPDLWVQRTIVISLSLTLCACVGGEIGLQIQNQPIPDLLSGLGLGALGTLANVSRSSSAQSEQTTNKLPNHVDSEA